MFVVKVLEDYAEMGKMVAKQCTKHQDMIQVYDQEVVEKVKKHLIHETLKGRGCVGQSKGYNNLFQESKMHQEHGSHLVDCYNLYLVISLGQVHL